MPRILYARHLAQSGDPRCDAASPARPSRWHSGRCRPAPAANGPWQALARSTCFNRWIRGNSAADTTVIVGVCPRVLPASFIRGRHVRTWDEKMAHMRARRDTRSAVAGACLASRAECGRDRGVRATDGCCRSLAHWRRQGRRPPRPAVPWGASQSGRSACAPRALARGCAVFLRKRSPDCFELRVRLCFLCSPSSSGSDDPGNRTHSPQAASDHPYCASGLCEATEAPPCVLRP